LALTFLLLSLFSWSLRSEKSMSRDYPSLNRSKSI
jgi:hypothetical protein